MTKTLTLIAAFFASTLAVAASTDWSKNDALEFRLTGSAPSTELNLSLFRGSRHNLTSTFRPEELSGLDRAAFRAPGHHPVAFAIVREAGRIACAGKGGASRATGSCQILPDPAFAAFLNAQGLASPNSEESYQLIVVDARADLLRTLAQHGYPRPDLDTYIELSAVGVTREFVAALASRGHRPADLDTLTEYAALDITPAFIDSFRTVGYLQLTPDELTQLAALKIDPQFIRDFAAIGYRNLSVDTLIELKAMDVTPDYVRSLETQGLFPRSVNQLVRLKAVGLEEDR